MTLPEGVKSHTPKVSSIGSKSQATQSHNLEIP